MDKLTEVFAYDKSAGFKIILTRVVDKSYPLEYLFRELSYLLRKMTVVEVGAYLYMSSYNRVFQYCVTDDTYDTYDFEVAMTHLLHDLDIGG
jgi:hypothetical protein